MDMKLVAGMGSLTDYEILVKAGANQVFVGFVPHEYYQKYGNLLPANRREVYFYHVQICTYEDMKILKQMEEHYQVPVSVTLNALFYLDEQMEEIYQIMQRLIKIGFEHFIVSDVGFLQFLKEKNCKACIEISGELGEMNSETIAFLMEQFENNPRIDRVIFQRKTSLKDMRQIIRNTQAYGLTYEGFFMNENCQFSGGYCNSIHCDELIYMCHVPYAVKPVPENRSFRTQVELQKTEEVDDETLSSVIGSSGCGLCNLWELREIGIEYLKIVGRGLSVENMANDLLNCRRALEILKEADSKEEYQRNMMAEIFPGGCSGNCYVIGAKI